MNDLHSHILFGVDDGAKVFEDSKAILDSASSVGVKNIVLTPHYIVDSRYMSTANDNLVPFKQVKDYADGLGINIYLANEVYLSKEVVDLYKSGKIAPINNSRYMLVEIPMYGKLNNVKSIFFELLSAGVVPILAHPERYAAYHGDIDFFKELRQMGVLLQANYPSLLGFYGKDAKKMLKKLLKADLISFVGSDVHSINEHKYELIPKMKQKLTKLVGKEKMSELTESNFMKVIGNELI